MRYLDDLLGVRLASREPLRSAEGAGDGIRRVREHVDGVRKVPDEPDQSHDVTDLAACESVDIVHDDHQPLVMFSQQFVQYGLLLVRAVWFATEPAEGTRRRAAGANGG